MFLSFNFGDFVVLEILISSKRQLPNFFFVSFLHIYWAEKQSIPPGFKHTAINMDTEYHYKHLTLQGLELKDQG